MTDAATFVTRAEIVAAAAAAGYGERRQLDLTFGNWQKRGLIGGMVGKANRRGGEGRWHPVQQRLFLTMLRNRAARVRLDTLANLPIGLWLHSVEGVELRQVQRAWGTYLDGQLNPSRPAGPDSLRRRSIEDVTERFAALHPASRAPENAKRVFRGMLDLFYEGAPDLIVSPDTLAQAQLDVMGAGDCPSAAQRNVVRAFYLSLHLKELAIATRQHLVTDGAAPFWEWARRQNAASMAEYLSELPRLQAVPGVGRYYERPDLATELNQSGPVLTQILGMGCDLLTSTHQLPAGWEMPPAIPGIKPADGSGRKLAVSG